MRSDRLNQMEALILSNGTVTLYDLAKHFDISLNTVRRDVAALIERGHIRKVYGGVSSIDALESQAFATLVPLAKRAEMHAEGKRAIGELAASLVEEESVVFLDSGSTVPHMVPHLARKNVRIVTHSLSVLVEAAKYPGLRVLALGGLLNHATNSLVDEVNSALHSVRVNTLFMAATALSVEWGASNNTYAEYHLKSELVSQNHNVIVLADSSKFGRNATYCYCPFRQIRGIVTDHTPPENMLRAIREYDIDLHCVDDLKGVGSRGCRGGNRVQEDDSGDGSRCHLFCRMRESLGDRFLLTHFGRLIWGTDCHVASLLAMTCKRSPPPPCHCEKAPTQAV